MLLFEKFFAKVLRFSLAGSDFNINLPLLSNTSVLYHLLFSLARKWHIFGNFFFKYYREIAPFQVFYFRYGMSIIRARLISGRTFFYRRFRGTKIRRIFSKRFFRRFMRRMWYFQTRKYRLARRDFALFFRLSRRFKKKRLCRMFRIKYVQMIRFVYKESWFILRQNKLIYSRFDKFPYMYFFRISKRRNIYKMLPFGWNWFYIKKDKVFGHKSRYYLTHTLNLLKRGRRIYKRLCKLKKKRPLFSKTFRPFVIKYVFNLFLRHFFLNHTFLLRSLRLKHTRKRLYRLYHWNKFGKIKVLNQTKSLMRQFYKF